ncbi:2437_t:CDS:1 [Paraglomus occultum]|uniref:2437_t:CDS:1 n=1 Tax=Paraglomus occultum TaxID=144539 RepID=A0A9N9DLW5_9GLOM|nr:2437_t:CDS:1 [Paraglomus occultum]
MSSISTDEELHLQRWSSLLADFYSTNNPLYGSIITLIEFPTQSNGVITLNFSLLDSNVSVTDVEPILQTLGFVNGVLVHSEDYSKYEKIKRQVRSAWHSKKAAELEEELNRLLNSKPAVYTVAHRRSEVTSFVRVFKDNVGAAPFIKGLRQVFELQQGKHNLVSWTFLDDRLTQNGPDFMRAAVNLLVNVLSFTHTIQEADESVTQETSRTWYFAVTIPDSEIKSLLPLLPKNVGSVRPTGTIEVSSQQRPAEMRSLVGRICWIPIGIVLFWWRFWTGLLLQLSGIRGRNK